MSANAHRNRLRYLGIVGPKPVHSETLPSILEARPEPRPVPVRATAPRQMRMEAVPLNRLFVPTEYQRDFNPSHAREIAKNFDPKAFTPPTVSERSDGRYAIVDGQHRCGGLRILHGADSPFLVWCMVVRFETIEDEARWFLAQNAMIKKSTSSSNFRAQEVSGDERARQLREIVERYGFTLHTRTGKIAERAVTPASLNLVLRQHGLDRWDVVDETMSILNELVADGQKVSALYVSGLGSFIALYRDHPAYRRKNLVESLKREAAASIDRDARALRSISKTSESTSARRAMLNAYNRGRQDRNRLPEL